MKPLAFITLCAAAAIAGAAGGCNSATRRTPALDMPAGQVQSAPQRDYLKEAGDATWRVVTAPVQIVSPMVTPKKPVAKAPPETFEPPALVIMKPIDNDEPLRPAATRP